MSKVIIEILEVLKNIIKNYNRQTYSAQTGIQSTDRHTVHRQTYSPQTDIESPVSGTIDY